MLFAGLDVSTQSCKLVVLDAVAGTVLHVGKVEYDRDLPAFGTRQGVVPGLGEGVSESDPRMWIQAVELLLGDLGAAGVPPGRIRCVSVSGQQHGLVALTADGHLARRRSKLWNDFSTTEECALLTEAVGGREAMIQEVGNTQRTGYTAPKILHLLRYEPDRYARARTLFLVHNYVNWHLTGGPEGGVAVMEPGDTSGMALWHPARKGWSRRVVDAIHLDLPGKLPPVLPSDRTIGVVAPGLADRFGLDPTCRVDAGSGDNMYGAVGTGNFEPGIVTVSLGTSGTAYTFLREPFIDPDGEIAAFCDSTGHFLPLLCVSNMANGYEAVREHFRLTHQEFDDLVLSTAPGNGGRVIVPWYQGERTPDLPLAAPLTFGFGPAEMGPGLRMRESHSGAQDPIHCASLEKAHQRPTVSGAPGRIDAMPGSDPRARAAAFLCRGVVEGHVLNLFDGFARLPVTPREVRVTGGLSASPAWCQVLADVFDTEVVPVQGEGAALGAAIHAAWVWERENGRVRTLGEVAEPFVRLQDEGRRQPHPEYRIVMGLLRRLYRSLASRVRGLPGEDPFSLRKELMEASRALDTPRDVSLSATRDSSPHASRDSSFDGSQNLSS
jgi:xylulokinase